MQADIAAVEDLYRRLIGAWNDRDAKAMAGLYTSRGAQVGFDGSAMETPASIESHLAPIFRDHPTARFIVKVRETRLIGTDAAILRAVAGMVKPDALDIIPDRNAIQTMVASRGDT